MPSVLDSLSSGPGLSPGRRRFGLGLDTLSASLHPRVLMGTGKFNGGGNFAMGWHPFKGVVFF